MQTFTNASLQAQLAENFGSPASDIDFLPFSDLEKSVRDDVETIRADPFIPEDIELSGFIFHVESGRLSRVV
jgi:carbonic anhydrase